MAGTWNILHAGSVSGDDAPQLGDQSIPTSVSFTNGVVYRVENASVADNYASSVLWAQSGGISTFVFGVIMSNVDLLMELKNSLGSPEYTLINIPANTPVYFGSTTRGGTSARISNGVQTTGLGNVTQITVQNNHAGSTGVATVQMLLFN